MFADKIKRLRTARKMTQRDLADALGIKQQTVCRWESGGGEPNIEMLIKLADFFNITIDQLVGHELKPDKPSKSEQRISFYLKELSDDQKDVITTLIKTLTQSNGKQTGGVANEP
jgi:transcriptional regulator with XRE-family HTH domain